MRKEKEMVASFVKYPDVIVPMVGEDGNAFAILGRVKEALQLHGVPDHEIKEFLEEAKNGDYDHLLATVMRTVNVE
jgi:hypothetical protein